MPGTTVGGGEPAVLEDPTGTRARWMGWAGRFVFLLFLTWLLAIVLGGLGLMPVAGIPLTHVLRPSPGPPPFATLPKPRQPSPSDLRPALSAEVFAARRANVAKRASHGGSGARKTAPGARASHGKSATAPGKTKTTPALAAAHGRSAVAPGQTKTTPAAGASHGKSATAPGKTKTTPALAAAHGRSAVAPGQTKTTTTSVRHPKKP